MPSVLIPECGGRSSVKPPGSEYLTSGSSVIIEVGGVGRIENRVRTVQKSSIPHRRLRGAVMRLVRFQRYRRKALGALLPDGRIVDLQASAAALLAGEEDDPLWEREVDIRLPADAGKFSGRWTVKPRAGRCSD